MCAEAWKVTEVGKEMVFSACGDICDNLDDKNNPWYPLFDQMKTKKCPIEAVSSNSCLESVVPK